jgi:hypothetical protein
MPSGAKLERQNLTSYPAKAGCPTCGKAANAGGAGRHGAGFELVVGDSGAVDSAPDQVMIQIVGQVAAIEPVGPLPQVARKMLGADPMMGADQPRFDVAEKRVDDREEFTGTGAVPLHHRGMFQIIAEIGVAAAIAGKPISQQMRFGGDIGFQEGSQFSPGRGWQYGDARTAGKEPVLALDGAPMLSAPVLRRRHLFDGSDDRALVEVGRAATGTCRVAAATDEEPAPAKARVSSTSSKPCSGREGSSLSPWRSLCAMVQAV